jgi:hypothetical protein
VSEDQKKTSWFCSYCSQLRASAVSGEGTNFAAPDLTPRGFEDEISLAGGGKMRLGLESAPRVFAWELFSSHWGLSVSQILHGLRRGGILMPLRG